MGGALTRKQSEAVLRESGIWSCYRSPSRSIKEVKSPELEGHLGRLKSLRSVHGEKPPKFKGLAIDGKKGLDAFFLLGRALTIGGVGVQMLCLPDLFEITYSDYMELIVEVPVVGIAGMCEPTLKSPGPDSDMDRVRWMLLKTFQRKVPIVLMDGGWKDVERWWGWRLAYVLRESVESLSV